ncbi:hypothetical protein BK412_10250 [Vibrio campbellii]|uniref:TcfC E-set like domain-containing protein n=1 Tax=Vibrio campbellii TaxID=680 RepID=UPI0009BE9281|nr:TcfC E-set like domain-containing protein [Vibrio campbellii]OQQ04002.1 hypothetical protein BK412_10250 [Vibrio campbellii]
MKLRHLSLVIFSSLLFSHAIKASDYPLDFADFFEQRQENVEVVLVGSNRTEELLANVSYDTFYLQDTTKSRGALEDYLAGQNVSEDAISKVTQKLLQGVPANPGCKVALMSCVPEDIPGQTEFIFDFDNKTLRIFASSEMFNEFNTAEEEYHSPVTQYGALINWSNLYVYGSDNFNSLAWTNEALLGLPVGYLSFNSQYRHDENDQTFDVFQALYNYEMDDFRAVIGYQDQNVIALNSTDFLGYGADFSGVSATLGSSNNLLKGSVRAHQRLHFYTSQSGQLEIYQGNRLLVSRVVEAGEVSVGYDELPTGTYTVSLVVKQGDKIVLEEQRQVVNNADFSLKVGDWDYRLDVGLLDAEESEQFVVEGSDSESPESMAYIRGLATHRPMENLLVGFGGVSNGTNNQMLIGANWSINERANLEYTIGTFTNGDLYQFGQLNVAPFSFSARSVKHNDLNEIDDLTSVLYDGSDTTEYSAGVAGELFGGHAFFNYFYHQTKSEIYDSESDNISLNWSKSVLGGDLSLNATYSKTDVHDTMNTSISWRRRFGNNVSTDFSVSADNDGYAYSRASVGYNRVGDGWFGSANATVRSYADSETVGEINGAINGTNESVNYDSYGYVDTQGGYSLSGSLSGTQIVTHKGIALTTEHDVAFVGLAPKWDIEEAAESDDAALRYAAYKDGSFWREETVKVGTKSVMPLQQYSDFAFELDVESGNVETTETNSEFFATPGSFYELDNRAIPLASQVFILNDMNGNAISNARCIGESCNSVEQLSDDGVFRVNFRRNEAFKLVSNKRLCVYDESLLGKRYVQAYCLPGLDNLDGQLVRQSDNAVIAQTKSNQALIFVGKYESTEVTKGVIERLNEIGLVSKAIDVGRVEYLYVQYQESYTTAQRTLLESLEAYVILDAINTKQLFTSR